ncbi:hypothetical protein FOTG_18560, partial [Fusarium oxysporum f. sp. vasinfectum 25433]
MLQSESHPSSESDSRRHARSPSPSCESVLENDNGIRHAAGRLFSERGERQEYVLVGGRRNRVFGDKEVNGSCGTATKRFFLQP